MEVYTRKELAFRVLEENLMKRLLVCLALVGLMAAPATADLIQNTMPLEGKVPNGSNTIGVYYGGSIIQSDFKIGPYY
jgi:opacity protein-like surface antigen